MNTKRSDEKPPQTPPPPYPGYPPPYWYYPPEQERSLLDYWGVIVKHKLLIIVITLLSTGIAAAAAFLMTPIYRAETLLAPVSEEQSAGLQALANQFGDLAALAGINIGGGKDKTAEYVAALKSRALSVAFIKERNLMPVLFADKWDKQNKRWKRDITKTPTEWDAFKIWDEDIRRVNFDRREGLVTLAIEWTDASLAANWANDLVKQVNNRLRTQAVEEAETTITYLQKELPLTTSIEVQQAIYRLIETQTKKKMVASTREEYAFQTIDPAAPPQERTRPKRLLIVITGCFLGLALSILVISFTRSRESRDRTTSG